MDAENQYSGPVDWKVSKESDIEEERGSHIDDIPDTNESLGNAPDDDDLSDSTCDMEEEDRAGFEGFVMLSRTPSQWKVPAEIPVEDVSELSSHFSDTTDDSEGEVSPPSSPEVCCSEDDKECLHQELYSEPRSNNGSPDNQLRDGDRTAPQDVRISTPNGEMRDIFGETELTNNQPPKDESEQGWDNKEKSEHKTHIENEKKYARKYLKELCSRALDSKHARDIVAPHFEELGLGFHRTANQATLTRRKGSKRKPSEKNESKTRPRSPRSSVHNTTRLGDPAAKPALRPQTLKEPRNPREDPRNYDTEEHRIINKYGPLQPQDEGSKDEVDKTFQKKLYAEEDAVEHKDHNLTLTFRYLYETENSEKREYIPGLARFIPKARHHGILMIEDLEKKAEHLEKSLEKTKKNHKNSENEYFEKLDEVMQAYQQKRDELRKLKEEYKEMVESHDRERDYLFTKCSHLMEKNDEFLNEKKTLWGKVLNLEYELATRQGAAEVVGSTIPSHADVSVQVNDDLLVDTIPDVTALEGERDAAIQEAEMLRTEYMRVQSKLRRSAVKLREKASIIAELESRVENDQVIIKSAAAERRRLIKEIHRLEYRKLEQPESFSRVGKDFEKRIQEIDIRRQKGLDALLVEKKNREEEEKRLNFFKETIDEGNLKYNEELERSRTIFDQRKQRYESVMERRRQRDEARAEQEELEKDDSEGKIGMTPNLWRKCQDDKEILRKLAQIDMMDDWVFKALCELRPVPRIELKKPKTPGSLKAPRSVISFKGRFDDPDMPGPSGPVLGPKKGFGDQIG
ncbi:hypothetical protein M501DRAFT_988444 [Patellaria atrata CBS 101060]|uniref:Uncharacterized protein n=1 Tax=Patellaria atrata CBS 101060 TaxID=1346257 RepID=A0A9P4VUP1_9PEZI|nr:hypothetical protein M501DRAFT_988444 [Patellaria atrata CBS 101060]